MIHNVFAVHDGKAEFFLPPFMFPHIAQAVRAVTDECARPDSMLARHPADFSLYLIATWNDQNGKYEPLDRFEFLGNGVSFLPARPDRVNGGIA